MQGCGFRDEFKKFQDKNIRIVGVSADSLTKQTKFVEKYNFPYLILCDESKEMLKSYKAWGPKKFMGKAYDGISRTTFVIDEKGMIEDIITEVKTKEHTEQILK